MRKKDCVILIFASVQENPDFVAREQTGTTKGQTRPQGYKTFFMLNSIEHKIYHAHKC